MARRAVETDSYSQCCSDWHDDDIDADWSAAATGQVAAECWAAAVADDVDAVVSAAAARAVAEIWSSLQPRCRRPTPLRAHCKRRLIESILLSLAAVSPVNYSHLSRTFKPRRSELKFPSYFLCLTCPLPENITEPRSAYLMNLYYKKHTDA